MDPPRMGSILRGIPLSKCRLREFQKIKIAKYGRRISLFHDSAAGAAGILSLDLAVGFHQNSATTSWIDAMPALPGFHDHGPLPPFARATVCPQKQSQVGPVMNGELR